MASPFDFINAINEKKQIEITREYNQFLVNRFYSLFRDTILIANLANTFRDIDDGSHFAFYNSMIKKGKRYTKWPKADKNEVLACISRYYDVSLKQARDIINILTDDQIRQIIEWSKEYDN